MTSFTCGVGDAVGQKKLDKISDKINTKKLGEDFFVGITNEGKGHKTLKRMDEMWKTRKKRGIFMKFREKIQKYAKQLKNLQNLK